MPDELSGAGRSSAPPSFDFDDDAIASLLDTFVETQTGSQAKRGSSHPPDPDDVGAQAAQRTVFQHAPRHEALPLVGDEPDTKRGRLELLDALAKRSAGSAKARLLTAAAELCEQLGDAEAAAERYRRALNADARDVIVLRALRRLATRSEDWARAAEALEREAALELSASERAGALGLLAQIQLTKLGDAAAAERSARRALELDERSFVTRISIAAAQLARDQKAAAARTFADAADCWPSGHGQAAILGHAASLMEAAGEPEQAHELFERVLAHHPDALEAHLGVVRTARAHGDDEGAVDALVRAASRATGAAAAGLRRTAAVAASAAGRLGSAAEWLDDPDDTASLVTRAAAAMYTGDLRAASTALARVAGEDDAILGVTAAWRARLHAELGEAPPADAAPHPALREYLRSTVALLGSDTAEARALDRLLASAPEEAPPEVASLTASDEAAGALDAASFAEGLRRNLGASLIRRERWLLEDDANEAALGWREEADATSGARSAFASTMAARLVGADPAAIHACDAALGAEPGYPPACWLLEEAATLPQERANAAALQAESDPENRSWHLLRAAIWSNAAEERRVHTAAALDPQQPDPLLVESSFASPGSDAVARSDLMWSASRTIGGSTYLIRAAQADRAAGRFSRAAALLRDASDAAPDQPSLRVRRREAELDANEFARLADDAMQRARDASSPAEELRAFAAMAEVDRLFKRDMQSARLALQSVAELRPDHIPTARALESDALHEGDADRIRASARRLLEALPPGSADRLARQRLIVELLRSDADILQDDIDRALRRIDDDFDGDPGLARQALGAAYAKGDTELALRALIALQAAVPTDLERAAYGLEAAQLLQRTGDHGRALESLNTAADHPLALEAEAALLRASKRWEDAAVVFEEAAVRAKDPRRAASLWRESAEVRGDELHDAEGALRAWIAAADADIAYRDVYRRLALAYRERGQLDDLAALIERRIDHGADTPTLVSFLLEKAALRRERGDTEGVVAALGECLELDPHHYAALRELVETHRGREDWQAATEALVRIARLKRSDHEAVWAFSQLAAIYHEQLDDLPRAEASLRRALDLAPAHNETLDRLASVLTERGRPAEAARLLQELVRRAPSEAEQRDYRIRLARTVELAGQNRQAEALLEQLRGERPTDVDVILSVADHYARQGAGPAESMHLNRALNDLRDAIEARPGDELLWTTLVRVLRRRHGAIAASCAASAAVAIGHPASLFEGDVGARSEALGSPKLPLRRVVDDVVAPKSLPQTVRRLFTLCEHSFDKLLPFDAAAWRLKRPSGAHRGLVDEASDVAEALGISEPKLRLTYIAPSSCMPISGDPPTLVVGGNLHELTTPLERFFLFARSLKIASTRMSSALRARPEELDTALLALLYGHDPSRPRGPEPEQLHDLRKRLMRAVPRRSRDEVESLVLELAGNSSFSTRLVPFAVSGLGDRVALTLTGDVPSAVDALLKVAGHDVPHGHSGRLTAIRETPEAWALVRFAISDAHFEARAQAGVDP